MKLLTSGKLLIAGQFRRLAHEMEG